MTCSDSFDIGRLIEYLLKNFNTRDFAQLKYFIGVEVARSKEGLCIS